MEGLSQKTENNNAHHLSVIENQEKQEFELELQSLEKGFGFFNSIRKTQEGFKVTLPGLVDMETKCTVGGTTYYFNKWEDAKNYYLSYMESKEKIKTEPIFEFEVNDYENLSFSDFEKFNPMVAPRKSPREIPSTTKRYILEQQDNKGDLTYENTIKKEDWEKKLFLFITDYLNSDEGKEILQKLNIKNLDLLQPRQAISLTTEIILNLTKYNDRQAEANELSKSDKVTTIDLLKDGIKNRNNAQWEGNGVCRNFAGMTKAVFEAIKNNQTKYNFLNDAYCVYNSGIQHRLEKIEERDILIIGKDTRPGHAWNTFVVVNGKESNSTVIDTTWAKYNLDTKEVENLDYTIKRTNQIVDKIILYLEKSDHGIKDKQMQQFIDYKTIDLDRASGNELKAKSFNFIKTLMFNFKDNLTFPKKLIIGLTKSYGYSGLADNADPLEIECLYLISKNSSDLPFDFILNKYLKNRQLSDYHVNKILFKDNDLQREVFRKLKNHPKFQELINSSLKFKQRIKDIEGNI